jgi:hypothetical protein
MSFSQQQVFPSEQALGSNPSNGTNSIRPERAKPPVTTCRKKD